MPAAPPTSLPPSFDADVGATGASLRIRERADGVRIAYVYPRPLKKHAGGGTRTPDTRIMIPLTTEWSRTIRCATRMFS